MSGKSVDTQSPDYPERVAEAMGISGDRLRASRPVEPWRFDVPEVPAHVTCIEDKVGWIWVREGAAWLLWRGSPGTGAYRLYDGDLIARAPLVECPDPRAAS